MATRIRASCHDCGDIELRIVDMQVHAATDHDSGCYVFTCPSCGVEVVKAAESRVLSLLLASGVRLGDGVWHRSPSDAPALTEADLASFREVLGDDQRVALFVARAAAGQPD